MTPKKPTFFDKEYLIYNGLVGQILSIKDLAIMIGLSLRLFR